MHIVKYWLHAIRKRELIIDFEIAVFGCYLQISNKIFWRCCFTVCMIEILFEMCKFSLPMIWSLYNYDAHLLFQPYRFNKFSFYSPIIPKLSDITEENFKKILSQTQFTSEIMWEISSSLSKIVWDSIINRLWVFIWFFGYAIILTACWDVKRLPR